MAEENEAKASDDKLTRILEGIVELKNDVKHLTLRMDTRATEIKDLEGRVKDLEIKLALNDQKTNKTAGWFDYVFKGILTLFAGYVAVRIGLK